MNNLVACALLPHPPIMVPEVGKGELEKIRSTVAAVEKAAQIIKDSNPQTIVVITPHGPVFRDAVGISVHPRLRGSLATFGVPEVVLGFETDGLLTRSIVKHSERLGINLMELTDDLAKTYRFQLQLDHGALVPLYYLAKAGFKGQLVHITIGMLPYEEMYTFGKAIKAAIGNVDKRVAVIASGDLSHKLNSAAPAGYSPRGQEFDRQLLAAFKDLNVKTLLSMDCGLIEEAGECGLRPVICLMGVLGGLPASAEVLSYEGPFGVGYGVGVVTFEQDKNSKNEAGKDKVKISPAVELAVESLQYYLEHGEMLNIPDDISPELERQAGVFVSFKKNGQLRGCIGTFRATQENVAGEIIANAVSAGTRDPRFPPIAEHELPDLDISVDILEEPEQIDSVDKLDPQKYGVIVRNGGRSGLLLPMLEGVDTVEQQLSIAMQKAGIQPKEPVSLYRFTVTRYK